MTGKLIENMSKTEIRNSINLQMHENGFVILDLNIPKLIGNDLLDGGIEAISKELQIRSSDFILLSDSLKDQLNFLDANALFISEAEELGNLPSIYHCGTMTVYPIKKFKLIVLNNEDQVNAFKSEFTKDPHLLQWTNVTVVCINYC